MTALRLATLDLPEGNAMRAPGEASGMMALEIAMDEMAERLSIDPIEFRIQMTLRWILRIRSGHSLGVNSSSACASAPSSSVGVREILNRVGSARAAGWSAWELPLRSATIFWRSLVLEFALMAAES
jgi:CO/xanthine dehydrogenase Mo-binding subunit